MITHLIKNKIFWLVIGTIASLVMLSATYKVGPNSLLIEKAVNFVCIPIEKGLSYIQYNVGSTLQYFNNAKQLSVENKNLKDKVAKLEEQNRNLQSLENENQRLEKILGIKDKYENFDMVTCKIIGKDTGNWFNTFTIDKGTKDGIGVNMTVMVPQGLVGQIVSAGPTSSKVMAIIDPGSSVSARLSKQRDLVVLRGDMEFKEQGLIKMDYVPVGVEVAQGDIVETSGMGGIFPGGIIIGKVTSIANDKPQLMRYAVVQPEVDFKRLEEVVVLKTKQSS